MCSLVVVEGTTSDQVMSARMAMVRGSPMRINTEITTASPTQTGLPAKVLFRDVLPVVKRTVTTSMMSTQGGLASVAVD